MACAVIVAACLLVPAPDGWAGSPDPSKSVRDRLIRWQADFNARRKEGICDLFAPDLRYHYGSLPEQGYDDVCSNLQRSLDDPERRYHYALEIEEILVSGEMAVVRLVWTLTITPTDGSGQEETTVERGLDVFWQQPDGDWKIRRFLALDQ